MSLLKMMCPGISSRASPLGSGVFVQNIAASVNLPDNLKLPPLLPSDNRLWAKDARALDTNIKKWSGKLCVGWCVVNDRLAASKPNNTVTANTLSIYTSSGKSTASLLRVSLYAKGIVVFSKGVEISHVEVNLYNERAYFYELEVTSTGISVFINNQQVVTNVLHNIDTTDSAIITTQLDGYFSNYYVLDSSGVAPFNARLGGFNSRLIQPTSTTAANAKVQNFIWEGTNSKVQDLVSPIGEAPYTFGVMSIARTATKDSHFALPYNATPNAIGYAVVSMFQTDADISSPQYGAMVTRNASSETSQSSPYLLNDTDNDGNYRWLSFGGLAPSNVNNGTYIGVKYLGATP